MPKRQRLGRRIHQADFQLHNGNLDDSGTPTYTSEDDWQVVIAAWPCEVLNTSGGETLRGRQVTAETTHVLIGEYFGVEGVTTDMRIEVNGQTLAIVSVLDQDGDSYERRIEAKREV